MTTRSPSRPGLMAVPPDDSAVTRAEFEAARARLAVVETQTRSIDGGEQDLREQLRTLKNRTFRQFRVKRNEATGEEEIEFVHDLSEDKTLEARMIRIEALLTDRIPPAWTQKTVVSFMVAIAVALLSKALGVPLPEIVP